MNADTPAINAFRPLADVSQQLHTSTRYAMSNSYSCRCQRLVANMSYMGNSMRLSRYALATGLVAVATELDSAKGCTSIPKADVCVKLQYKSGGVWKDATGYSCKRVYNDTGSSTNRANARRVCLTGTASYYWSSVIDVDIVGLVDPPDKQYTPEKALQCRPV